MENNKNRIVFEMEQAGNKLLRFTIKPYKSREVADLRIFYQDSDGEWKPSKSGIQANTTTWIEFLPHLMDFCGLL